MTVQTRKSPVGDGEHVVQFYDRDRDLVRAVGDYLTRALSEGEAAVVIATQAHCVAFEAELIDGGIDVARAVADGSLVVVDAAEMLTAFMLDGEIDPVAFRANVGSIVERAQETGRPVRAYGEMVAILWDAGEVLSAIELEKLWNDLGSELNFALWCGYHARSVAADEQAEALLEVCHLHTAVVDVATARFRAGTDAPLAARRFVTGLLGCRPYGHDAPVDDAQLVVSELATNAVIHAGSPFSVSVRYDGSSIRISVHDWNPAPLIVREGGPTARSGRGLRMIEMVSGDWGVETSPDGKTVWADLPMR